MESIASGKRETTHKLIVEKAAELFNCKGYAGTSVSDIMAATGMEKGGIYGHFKSKKAIALAAFDYNMSRVFRSFDPGSFNGKSAAAKLSLLFTYLEKMYEEPFLSGGCPLLNTATEADDTDRELLLKVRTYLDRFKGIIAGMVKEGIQAKTFRADIDPEDFAVICIEIFEGGNLLAKVYNDKSYRRKAIARIQAMIATDAAA